jgi:hypothetical protein
MESPPELPAGYEEPEEYQLPTWPQLVAVVILAILFLLLLIVLDVHYVVPDQPLASMTALIFGVAGAVYLHESAHYLTTYYLNYKPEFVWPNRVNFGVNLLRTKPTVLALLAPQVLSVLYVILLVVGVPPSLEALLIYALAVNLFAGELDIVWAVRRLTWPNGTIVIPDGEDIYVAFPGE